MIKEYKLINEINLTTSVLVGGKIVPVSFGGGSRNSGHELRRGRLVTEAPDLQAALEADRGYGSVFVCVTPGEESSETPAEIVEEAPKYGPEIEQVPNIAKRQDAMLWLEQNKGLGLKQTATVADIKQAAHDCGVAFIDWQ